MKVGKYSLILCILFTIMGGVASATNWTGTTGDWFTSSNWDAGVPASSDGVAINNGGTAQIATSDAYASYINIGNAAGNSGTLEISSGSFTSVGYCYLANNATGTGTLSVSGGTVDIDGEFRSEGGTGYMNVSGGILNLNGVYARCPNGRTGAEFTYTQTGGTATFDCRTEFKETSAFNLSNGVFNATGTHFSFYGDFTGTMSSGTLDIDTYYGFDMAPVSGDSFTFTQSGGLVDEDATTTGLRIGNGGTATYNLNGGTIDCQTFSIGTGSNMDIEPGAMLIIDGDVTSTIATYISDDRITAEGDTGTINYDYNSTTPYCTTVIAYDPNYNFGPSADAGGDFAITLPDDDLVLYGSGSDDGMPEDPGVLSCTWSKTSGPSTVTFADDNALSNEATFGAAGTYVLKLTVSDGDKSDFDEVTITVNAAVNQKPDVYAGPDQRTMVPFDTVDLDGTTDDDGLPASPGSVSTTWSVESSPSGSTVTFGSTSAEDTTAQFDKYGTYVLKLNASDGTLSNADYVTIEYAQADELTPAMINDPVVLFDMDQTPADANSTYNSVVDTTGHTAGFMSRTDDGLPSQVTGAAYFTGDAWDFASVESSITGIVTNDYYIRLIDPERVNGFSISFWVNAQNLTSAERLAGFYWGSVEISRSGSNLSGYFGGPSVATTTAPLDGTWHQVTYTVDYTTTTNNLKVYVDGTLDNTASYTFDGRIADASRADHMLYIGARSSGGTSYFWPGKIDDFALYDYALGTAEIAYLANGLDESMLYRMDQTPATGTGTITDATGNTSGTTTATLPTKVEGAATDAWDFSSTTSVLAIASDETTDNFGDTTNTSGLTVSFWMNCNYSAGIVGDRITGFGSVWDFNTSSENSKGKLAVTMGGATINHDNSVVDIYDGNWHHVTVSADFSTSTDNVEMYIDGYYHDNASYSFSDFSDSTNDIIIGADSSSANQWTGMIDNFSVYEYPLNAREIAHLAPRNAPKVDAGDDQAIALPTATASLAASVDCDNIPSTATATYTWSLVEGPSSVTFTNANALSTSATFSPTAGKYNEYTLKLTASDSGVTSSDEIVVVFFVNNKPTTRTLPENPMPNVHPRVLFTREDIPEIRNRGKNLPLAAACVSSLSDTLDNAGNIWSATGLGAAYEDLKLGDDTADIADYVWEPGDAGNSGNSYLRGDYKLYGQVLGAAYISLVNDDTDELDDLATALATAAKIHYETYVPAYNSYLAHDCNVDLGIAYDILHEYMTETERGYCRDMIAAHTAHRMAFGAGQEDYANSTNWRGHHDYVATNVLAIEDEDGYDHHVHELNVKKLRRFYTKYGIHASGYPHEGWGYYEFGQIGAAPSTLATARRDENFFQTTRYYDALKSGFYEMYLSDDWLKSHHDGSSWDQSGIFAIANYMYPADKMVDHFVQGNYLTIPWPRSDKQNLRYAFFAQAPLPDYPDVTDVASDNSLPLTLFCKDRGMMNTRSDWSEEAIRLDFECRMDLYQLGHVHNDRNNFSMFAVGRTWVYDSKYPQQVFNDGHATVLIDDVGQAGSTTLESTEGHIPWPSMPGVILDHEDTTDYTMTVGDATVAYSYGRNSGYTGFSYVTSNYDWTDFMYDADPNESKDWWYDTVGDGNGELLVYNLVERAYRTAVMVRGDYPYVLIIDDIEKDNSTHSYEWVVPLMPTNDFVKVSGDATDIVLRHTADTAAGDPRLLIRALEANGTSSNWSLENRTYDTAGTCAALERTSVIAPDFKMLLFPHYNGESLPTTTWVDSDTLTIEIGDTTDTFDFTVSSGLTSFTFTRSTIAAPTGLAATPGDASVSLDWDDNSEQDLDSYNVYRSTTSGSYGTALATDVSVSNYTDNTAANGTTYYYVVSAVNTSSEESANSSEVSAAPSDSTAPAAPTGLAATAGDGSVSLDWNDNSEGDLSSYSVYRSTTSGSYGAALATGVSPSNYTDNTASNGTTYYYVVTAVDTSSNESSNSTEDSATPAPAVTAPTVTNAAATSITSSSATLNGEVTATGGETPTVTIYWGDNDGGTTPANWDSSINMSTQSSTFSSGISSLTSSTTYYFRCYASNSGGNDWADSTAQFDTLIANTYWDTTTGSWLTAANWTAGIPTASVNAYINNSGTAQVAGTAVCDNMKIAEGASTGGTLEVNSGSLTVGNTCYIVNNNAAGTATINVSGGTLDFEGEFRSQHGAGYVNVSGGEVNFNGGYARLPNGIAGAEFYFTQTAGTTTFDARTEWKETYGIDISDGVVNAIGSHFELYGSGATVDISGGTLNVSAFYGMNICTPTSTSCTVTQTGGVINQTSSNNGVTVGNLGTATYYLDAGTIDCLAFNIGSTSSMDIDAGTIIVDGDESTKINGYVSGGTLTAYGGTGTVNVDYNVTNAGKTTVTATAPDTTPPAAPTGLAATAGDGSVSLDWNDNGDGDLASYSVYRSTTSGSYGAALATGVSVSNYTDNTTSNGTTYYYVVTAVDDNSNESSNSTEDSATPADSTAPAAPTGLAATAGDGSVSLDWNDNGEGDLASYSVYRSTTSGSYGAALATGVSVSNYTDNTASNGTTYYYVVTAVDTNSNESSNSNEDSATPQSSGPTTLLDDDFEGTLGNWTTDWALSSSYYVSSSNSVECDSADSTLTTGDLDCSSASQINISFKYRINNIDANDNIRVWYYNGSSYDVIEEIGDDAEDTWLTFSDTVTSSTYLISNFKIQIDGSSIDNNENLWIDDVLITVE